MSTMDSSTKWSETLYFLIDGKFYDLHSFINKHPGGPKLLRYSKEYAYDQTSHFGMHHVNFDMAYNILSKYLITDEKLIEKCKIMIEKEKETNELYKKQLLSKAKPSKNNNNNNKNTNVNNRKSSHDYSLSSSSDSDDYSSNENTSESGIEDDSNEGPTSDDSNNSNSGTRQNFGSTQQNLKNSKNFEKNEKNNNNNSKYNEEHIKLHQFCFELPGKNSFYNDLLKESWNYFRSIKHKTGPKQFALNFWWFLIVLYCVVNFFNIYYAVYYPVSPHATDSANSDDTYYYYTSNNYIYYGRIILLSFFAGIVAAWLGGYGHQWSHMPAYRIHAHILDYLGLYSHTFRKEHLLLHHAFTNTICDNHFDGTEPFITVNPIIKRNFIQKYCTITLVNAILFVGIFGNYFFCGLQILLGKEQLRWFYFIFPAKLVLFCILNQSIVNGIMMFMIETCINSYYYFLIALMNHNQSILTWNLERIMNSRDWGEYQLAVSCDIGYNYNWFQSMLCLWLNYHTVHHLLPTTDMSHHQSLQLVLTKVSEKHGIKYNYKPFWQAYLGLLETVSVATALHEITNE